MNALVLGAGGFLGLNLVDALLAAGERPRCGRRRRSNVLALRRRRVSLVPADLDSPPELLEAMTGCDVVFHLAGHYPRLSLDRDLEIQTGLRQMGHLLEAAAQAGVRRLIYVSSTATVAPSTLGPSTEEDVFESPPDYGTYHELKWRMEELAAAERRLEVVVVCPGACLGPWDLRVGTSAVLVMLARGWDPPHPDGIVNLVDVRDVATALVRLASHERPPKRILLSGASRSLQPLLETLAVRYGVPRPSPALAPQEAVDLANVQEVIAASRGARPELSREIVDLILHGVPIDAGLAETVIGMRWTPLEETLDAFDAWARRMHILPNPMSEERSA